jgi:hypothetical protein
VLGISFAVGAVLIPTVSGGFLLTAAILGLTGIVLIVIGLRVGASAQDAQRIAQTGLSGSATITGLTQTGVQLNDNPQVDMELLVQLPGRPPYAARRKEFVPLIFLGRLTSGAPLPIKADPADPSRVIIDWERSSVVPPIQVADPSVAAPAGAETLEAVQQALAASGLQAAQTFASPGQGQYTVDQLREIVRATGIEGTARIDSAVDSGRTIGDERLFTMQVTLSIPGRAPEQTPTSAAMVPLRAAPRVRVGQTVPVRVHPENVNIVLFEWDRIQP